MESRVRTVLFAPPINSLSGFAQMVIALRVTFLVTKLAIAAAFAHDGDFVAAGVTFALAPLTAWLIGR